MAEKLQSPSNIWPRSNASWVRGVEIGLVVLLAVVLGAIVLNTVAPRVAVPLLAALPIVPLFAMIRSPSVVRTNKPHLRQWRLIVCSFFVIAIANCVPILVEPDPFDPALLLSIAVIPAAALFTAYFAVARRIPLLARALPGGRSATGLVALASVLYGFGLVTNVNALGTAEPVGEFRGVIVAKTPKQGRGSNNITVADTMVPGKYRRFPLSHEEFVRLRIGQGFCVTVLEGNLGVRVYQPHACPPIERLR